MANEDRKKPRPGSDSEEIVGSENVESDAEFDSEADDEEQFDDEDLDAEDLDAEE